MDLQEKKARLDAVQPLDAELLARLDAWYDVELTYTSNAIEGNALTRSETAIVLEKGITVRGKPLKDHEEAVDHIEALRFVRQLVSDPRPVTESDVRNIHALVVARTQNGEAGKYSSHQRMISGSDVVLPSPEVVPSLMNEFGLWLQASENNSQTAPENAIEAHLKLVTIHPFSDGNGRTARLLMNLLLMRDGWPPLVIDPEQRPDYIDSLEQAQLTGEISGYRDFMLTCLERSFDTYANKIDLDVDQRHNPSF